MIKFGCVVFLFLIVGCAGGLKNRDLDVPILDIPEGALQCEECFKDGVTREEVRDTVRSSLPTMSKCYTRALKRDNQLSGKITLVWEFTDEGSVTKVEVDKSEMSSNDSEFESCLMDAIKQTKFPKTEHGLRVLIRYPFVFRSK